MARTPDSDPELSRLLATWKVAPASDPAFRSGVWHRLAQTGTRGRFVPVDAVREYLSALTRPAFAAALLGLSAALGFAAADLRQAALRQRYNQVEARRYLASIDPLAMNAAMNGEP